MGLVYVLMKPMPPPSPENFRLGTPVGLYGNRPSFPMRAPKAFSRGSECVDSGDLGRLPPIEDGSGYR